MTDLRNRRTAVYRFYDESGDLLYVGIACNPPARWESHAGEKPWWSDVTFAALEWHPDRDSAEGAERRAIRTENPRHNIMRPDAPGPPWTLNVSPSLASACDALRGGESRTDWMLALMRSAVREAQPAPLPAPLPRKPAGAVPPVLPPEPEQPAVTADLADYLEALKFRCCRHCKHGSGRAGHDFACPECAASRPT